MVENLNRQRVLNLLDALYAGDIEAALARCSDDVELIAPAPIDVLPHMGHRRGKDAVRKMWQTVLFRYSSQRHELRDIVAEGDKVALSIRAFFTKRDNNRVVQFDMAVFYTLRDGRITHMREILDSFDLVQQVLECDLVALLASKPPNEA
jgi:ketosteroid isomerase-like protein